MPPRPAGRRSRTRSFPWERDALTFVRDRLHDHDPYRAWANFEFIADDGSINEVDLLVLTPKGFYLVEIKSRPGIVEGDQGTWTWRGGGRVHTVDNPLLLANRKAKKLISLLRRQPALQRKPSSPFLEAHVFLSYEDVDCRLAQDLRDRVHLRDTGAGRDERPGIFNWQTGAREALDTGTTGPATSGASRLDPFVEETAWVYMAPEAVTERGPAGEQLDVFSLGAIAYHLFSGRPPASSLFELTERLRDEQGLRISSVLDGAGDRLQLLVQYATHPEVTTRLESVREFLEELERLQDELTRPENVPGPTLSMHARATSSITAS